MAGGDFVSYLRVSTTRQGQSGLGLDAQREAVRAYLNGGDWRVVEEVVEVESGRNSERPALQRALAAARVRQCPLIVANVSRLTRSVAFLSRLLEAGVDVRFADMPAIEGPTGRFMLQQMAAVAELEAGMISARTKAALKAAKERGKRLGGYRGKGAPDGEVRRASVAARKATASARANDLAPVIAELQGQGVTSKNALAKALTARGIPTSRGRAIWTPTGVSRVLSAMA